MLAVQPAAEAVREEAVAVETVPQAKEPSAAERDPAAASPAVAAPGEPEAGTAEAEPEPGLAVVEEELELPPTGAEHGVADPGRHQDIFRLLSQCSVVFFFSAYALFWY